MRKLDAFDWYSIAIAIIFALVYPAVLFLLPVAVDSTVPTLVNGITTSMSIIIALGAAVIGIVFRSDIEKDDSKAKRTYFYALSLLIIPLIYPWGSYIALASGTSSYAFAVRYSMDGYLVALLAIIIVYLLTARRWNLEREEKSEKPKPEENKTTNQTNEKRRKWLSIEALTLIALIISTGFNIYYAYRTDNLQNSLYSLTYFQPFIYSINATSTLSSAYSVRNDTMAVLIGRVAVDLKVVTPYDGVLTIDIKTLNVSRISELNSELNMSLPTLNYSEHPPSYLDTTIHQYFISKNVINSVEDNLVVRLTVILKSNWISPNSTGIGFDLGDLMFAANLFAIQRNETMTQTFFEDVYGMFTPTS